MLSSATPVALVIEEPAAEPLVPGSSAYSTVRMYWFRVALSSS